MRTVTRSSGILATLLAMALVAAAQVRLTLAPYAVETAASPFAPAWWRSAVAVAALAAAGMAICRAAVKAGMFRGFCTLPIPIFAIVACGITAAPDPLSSSLATLCIAIGTMMFIRNILDEQTDAVLLGALLFGGAALLYPPASIFILMLPAMLVICPLSPRLLALAAVGWLLPVAVASYVNWYAGAGIADVVMAMAERFTRSHEVALPSHIPFVGALMVLLAVVLLAVGLVRRYAERNSMLVRTRKVTQFVLLLLLFSAVLLAIPSRSAAALQIAAIPVSILVAYALEGLPLSLSNTLYRLLVLLAILHLFVA